ncbi:MAG: alpha-1,4-glucan--maltose-1-phosphate maltosyltransferase [Actinomycetota bacterium]|nr:alpha-1,4-glucan--maltose-1-phosphate maltosyltransferase [Actinomycetota bacterium]
MGAIDRFVIQDITPRIRDGEHPAKAILGDPVMVAADIFRDGHDVLAANVRCHLIGSDEWSHTPMRELPNHRWEGEIEPSELGLYEFEIEVWTDQFATWRRAARIKADAGQSIEVELEEGALLLEETATHLPAGAARELRELARKMRDKRRRATERLAAAVDAPGFGVTTRNNLRPDLTRSKRLALRVERLRAAAGAWYELFPRSYGGLEGTTKRLSAVSEMGFDVVYLPPIHPIGKTDRKGRNNTITALPGDPGSPWAIGSEEGGHTAIHPELGTFDDFDRLLEEAGSLGLEVAMDYALQCSPDHPWVKEHPEWFHHRPDGTIKFAENPPKKYQDIYPINFWPEKNREGLWQACKDILDFWIEHGIRIFRVDNPHTKPLAFWEWMLKAVFDEHPDVVFLAEAFTHPKMMAKLAEIGFSQSYTYFTWRTHKQEIIDYVSELAQGPLGEYMRPNFWPNTPDILSGPLRGGNTAAFKLRLALAATMSPAYGIYSGYELCENEPARETDEEYLNSEKYEIKHRSWDAPWSITPYITNINGIRHEHRAFLKLRNLTFHYCDNPNVIVYSKAERAAGDILVIAVNLNSDGPEETTASIDFGWLGFDRDRPVDAHDLLSGYRYPWMGPTTYFRLDPSDEPAQIFHVTQPGAGKA